MTDFLPDTPPVARPYCPVCEPNADPSQEILDIRWCLSHTPSSGGIDDGAVVSEAYLSGSAEAGGDENRRWCQLLHRAGPASGSNGSAAGRGNGVSPARRRDDRRP